MPIPNWNEEKTVVIPSHNITTKLTRQFAGIGSIRVTTALGNEGLNLLTWIQSRLDDGDLSLTIPSATDLSQTVNQTTIDIESSTGTDITLATAVASSSTHVGGNAGIVTAQSQYRINNAILDISTTSDIAASFSSGSNPITKTAFLFINNNAVTNAKLADMPALTLKGNSTGSTGDPQDLSVATVQSMLGITPFSGTDLTYAAAVGGDLIIQSSTGADVTLPTATISEDGTMSKEDKLYLDSIVTLSGTTPGDTDLGSFSGSIITTGTTVKNALQELETAIEAITSPDGNGIYDGSGSVPLGTVATIDDGIEFSTLNSGPFVVSIGNLFASGLVIADTYARLRYQDVGSQNDVIVKNTGIELITINADRVLIDGADARYAADYSGTFVARSLVDKDYVDTAVSGLSLPIGVDTQTLRYNGTTLEASSVITNNGANVGIGGSPSAAQLEVYGYTINNGNIIIEGAGSGTGSLTSSCLRLTNTSGGGQTWFLESDDTAYFNLYGGGGAALATMTDLGEFSAFHYATKGTAPTVTVNPSMTGIGATNTVVGTDNSFSVQITMGTGTLGTPSGRLFTVTYTFPFLTIPRVVAHPDNLATASLDIHSFTLNRALGTFEFHINTNLSPGDLDLVVLKWNFITLG